MTEQSDISIFRRQVRSVDPMAHFVSLLAHGLSLSVIESCINALHIMSAMTIDNSALSFKSSCKMNYMKHCVRMLGLLHANR